MDTKFVKNFLFPREVICADRLVNYGFCQAARKFKNGSFALLKENTIDLFDAYGRNIETSLEDVFVFQNGYRLQKKSALPFWQLLSLDGKVVFKAGKVEVCDDRLFALRTEGDRWNVYQFSVDDWTLQFLMECHADVVKLFRCKESDDFVAVLQVGDNYLLQIRNEVNAILCSETDAFRSFVPLWNGQFAVSQTDIRLKQYGETCLLIEAMRGGGFDLYDDRLKCYAENVAGLVVWANDMFLINEKNEWKFFSADGKLLHDKIYHLSIYDAPDIKQCILFARTENDERVVIRLKNNGWLHVTYGNEFKFWTPDGRCVEAQEGCYEPFWV